MKTYIKRAIYILIIMLFLQQLCIQIGTVEVGRVSKIVLVGSKQDSCSFKEGRYYFTLPDCERYKPGSVVQVTGLVDTSFSREYTPFDTGFFEKKRLIVESIDTTSTLRSSPEVWFRYLGLVFKEKKQILLNSFLSIFDPKSSYLIGRLSFGFSQVKSRSVDHLFKVTGTQYLASVSGFHLNLFVRFFVNIAKKFFKKKITSIIALLISSFYLVFIGFKIPLVRAFLMLFLSVVANGFLFRQNNPIYSLLLVAIFILLIDITAISSISFQLSFAATAAIIIFTKNIRRNKIANLHISNFIIDKKKSKKPNKSIIIAHILNYIRESARISIYVQIIIIPLVIYHFNEFSIVSLFVSVALTWLVPGIIILGFLLLLVSVLDVNGIFIRLLALPLDFLSKIFISILKLFDNDIFIIKATSFSWIYVLAWWIAIFLCLKLLNKRKSTSSLKAFL